MMEKTILLLKLQHSAEHITNTLVNTVAYDATELSKGQGFGRRVRILVLFLFLKDHSSFMYSFTLPKSRISNNKLNT